MYENLTLKEIFRNFRYKPKLLFVSIQYKKTTKLIIFYYKNLYASTIEMKRVIINSKIILML